MFSLCPFRSLSRAKAAAGGGKPATWSRLLIVSCYWKPVSHWEEARAEAKRWYRSFPPPFLWHVWSHSERGGTARAQHWAGKRKSTPHPVAVATWGRPVRFSLWSRLVSVIRPPLDWNQSTCSITSHIKTFCASTDQMGIVSNKNKRKISTNKWK